MSEQPSPELFFSTVTAYQRTAAVKAAVDLELFTAIAAGAQLARDLVRQCEASERGTRILCDYLVTIGFLTKSGDRYGLTPDSAVFLDKSSPAYVGSAVDFLLSPMLKEAFDNLTPAVRKGGTALANEGSVTPENSLWVDFARAMAALVSPAADALTQLVPLDPSGSHKVLDIAAGHGKFGIAFAKQYPNARVTALDWPDVLQVAQENARSEGLEDRFSMIAGDAFKVDLGADYDIILITNFLHHFDLATCESFLRKVRASLLPGGKTITLEFVPNADRVSPEGVAGFSLVMLGTTPSGDAYTFEEFQEMFRAAGFSRSEWHELPPPTVQSAVISCA